MYLIFKEKKNKKEKVNALSYLRSCPLSSEETSSMWTWSHSCWKKKHQMINYFKGECVHHMLNTDEEMIVAGH